MIIMDMVADIRARMKCLLLVAWFISSLTPHHCCQASSTTDFHAQSRFSTGAGVQDSSGVTQLPHIEGKLEKVVFPEFFARARKVSSEGGDCRSSSRQVKGLNAEGVYRSTVEVSSLTTDIGSRGKPGREASISRREVVDGQAVGNQKGTDGAIRRGLTVTGDCVKLNFLKCLSCCSSVESLFNLAVSNASTERETLLGFKDKLTNASALRNWNVVTGAATEHCKWTGITCDANRTHVVSINLSGQQLEGSISPGLLALSFLASLDLSYNNLLGEIPLELANLTSLVRLDLSFNALTGAIPGFGGELQSLEILNLSGNLLTGVLPDSLGDCKMLQTLDVSQNKLNGTIPESFGNLGRLQNLILTRNKLSGLIPAALGKCSSLVTLNLGRNQLSGDIPQDLGDLKMIQALYLSVNDLTGPIPESIGQFQNLTFFHFYGNRINGSIPSSLGSTAHLLSVDFHDNTLTGIIPATLALSLNLYRLDLRNNLLSGSIPPEFGQLSQLQYLRLGSNLLSGILPSSLGNCSQLRVLVLNDNNFSENIPTELGQIRRLSMLDISGNALSGQLPNSLSNCVRLEVLEFSSNKLTGDLPDFIAELKGLFGINLSSNSFSGEIPKELGNLTQLQYLELEDNLLVGAIPSSLGNVPDLQVLRLGSNQLTGAIPSELSRCSRLSTVTLNNNLLNGPIPDSFGQLQFLNAFDVHQNMLFGNIPESLGNCTNLQYMDLSYNWFSGTVPPQLFSGGLNPNLKFSLAHNMLSGSLPMQVGLWTLVQTIELSGNNFSSRIPNSLGNCSGLKLLDISQNSVTGNIPTSLEFLRNLEVLNLSQNSLEGSIPTELGSLNQLVSLDLSVNSLSGMIPSSLSSLPNLVFLNLSQNNLQGPVSESGSFGNLSAASFLDNPGLCGPILNRRCETVAAPASTPSRAPVPTPGESVQSSKSGGLSSAAKVGIACGAAGFVFIIMCLIGIWWCWRIRPRQDTPKKRGSIIARSELFYPLLRFNAQDVRLATENFSDANVLGIGNLGTVYRGVLPELVLVAVKKVRLGTPVELLPTLIAEMDVLSKIRNRNLVVILGYCFDADLKAIVLQYMSNGSLDAHLHRGEVEGASLSSESLSWEARMKIGIGIAKGLCHLHNDCGQIVSHGDLKSSNVLLDSELEPHVSDYGLATLFESLSLNDANESGIKLSSGYVPPEHQSQRTATPKGDVYSYGVLLLEILTGRRPTNELFIDGLTLPGWVQSAVSDKTLTNVIDSSIVKSSLNQRQVALFVKVALMCTREAPEERPTMRTVLDLLK